MDKPTPIMILVLFLALLTLPAPFASAYGVVFNNPVWNQQDGKIFDVVYSSIVYEFSVKNTEISITALAFKLNKTTHNAGITVYKLNSIPDFLPVVNEGTAYEFNELRYVGFVPFHVLEMKYDFKVSKEWLNNNSVSSQNILLYSYNRVLNVWEVLPTDIIKEDDSFVFFKSAGKAVHYLFVGIDQSLNKTRETPVTPLSTTSATLSSEEVESILESSVDDNSEEQPSTTAVSEQLELPLEGEEKEIIELSEISPVVLETNSPALVVEAASQPDTQSLPSSERASKSSSSGLLIFLVVLAVLVVLILAYVVFGKQPLSYSIKRELDNYVKESMKRGKSEDEIRKRLLEVGWHQDRVNRALLRYRRKNLTFKTKESRQAG